MGSTDRPLADASIENLVEGLRTSSPEEAGPYCEEIIRRFEPLLRKAWRHVPATTEYRDFVQDVFVRLFGNLPRLENPRAFPGYFQRIVQTTASAAIRAKAPQMESIDEAAIERVVSRVDQEILAAVFLQSYLHLLPPREGEVLRLEWVDGLSPAEIMKKLGLSRGGISAAKSRGINKLRDIIASEGEQLDRQSRGQ
jgi:RNA polymerase sigma-70 factor (ECF subfamily)